MSIHRSRWVACCFCGSGLGFGFGAVTWMVARSMISPSHQASMRRQASAASGLYASSMAISVAIMCVDAPARRLFNRARRNAFDDLALEDQRDDEDGYRDQDGHRRHV